MQAKAKIILIILAAAVALCVITVFALWHNRDKHIIDGPGMVYHQEEAFMDDVFELKTVIGKTPEETGFDRSQLSEYVSFTILNFKGKLFESDAYGSVYFSGEERNGENEASTVYIQCKEMSFSDCRESMIALFGEPEAEGEEPYVEVNGGALSWCDFESEGLKISLTMGSEHDYFDITISKSKEY